MDENKSLCLYIQSGKSGGNNNINSVDIVLFYKILKNDIPYSFNPQDIIVDVKYPDNHKEVIPVVSKCTGMLRYKRNESFTLEGKKSVEVKFSIESDKAFNLDSLNVQLLSSKFVTRDGNPLFSDPIRISSHKWLYR